jgi:hypothetical protein
MCNPVLAHELRPPILSVEFGSDIQLKAEVNLEAILAGIGPEHDNTDNAPNAQRYRDLRDSSPLQLEQMFADQAATYAAGQVLEINGTPVDWRYLNATIPEVGDTRLARKSQLLFKAEYPRQAQGIVVWKSDPRYGDSVINLVGLNGKRHSHWLKAGEATPPTALADLGLARPVGRVFADYIGLGFVHIVPRGLDHILFVLGLFLLSRKLGPLLWQVTAFTLAHSATLALSIYGVISLPATLVEPLIALSIAYVGLENMLTKKLMPWRVVLVFCFGLLHGLGFAGVLTELGLPESEFVTALIGFNLGVEAGQLAVILLAFGLVFGLRHKDALYRNLVIMPGSATITLMGLYWFWTRI